MVKNWKCKIGFHKYKVYSRLIPAYKCVFCGKIQIKLGLFGLWQWDIDKEKIKEGNWSFGFPDESNN